MSYVGEGEKGSLEQCVLNNLIGLLRIISLPHCLIAQAAYHTPSRGITGQPDNLPHSAWRDVEGKGGGRMRIEGVYTRIVDARHDLDLDTVRRPRS